MANRRVDDRQKQVQVRRSREGICESETHHATTVLPSEGNEVRQDGFQEVGTLRSTYETGEHAPVDPGEERESQFAELLEGKMMGTSSLKNVSTKLQQVAELSRNCIDDQMRLFLA